MSTLVSADAAPPLPAWADELRHRYLRGESSQFVLYGNVHDEFLYDDKLYTLSEFLAQVLLARSKDTIALYNVSTGVRFTKRKLKLDGLEELLLAKEPAKVLPLLERALTTEDKLARHPRVRRHHRARGRHLVLDHRRPRRVGDAAPLVAVARARAGRFDRHPDAGEPDRAAPEDRVQSARVDRARADAGQAGAHGAVALPRSRARRRRRRPPGGGDRRAQGDPDQGHPVAGRIRTPTTSPSGSNTCSSSCRAERRRPRR